MKRRIQNGVVLIAGALAICALGVATAVDADVILFNHTPSIPVGLYVRTDTDATAGTVVTVRARDVAPEAARARHYDGAHDRFIKRVAAVAGQEVCGNGDTVSVDGRFVASVYAEGDRSVPSGWVGCRRLSDDEVLLLGDSADSFDGRYWGPISARLIEGVWRPL